MIFQQGYIRYKDNVIHCVKTGKGQKLMLAFHGFGQDAHFFKPFASALEQEYTTIAIDLPGHGKTKWTDPVFDTAALMAIVQGFKNDLNTDQLSLLGYSIGCRLCLSIITHQANWVEQAYLMAPDGLKRNFFYELATKNFFGKKIFKAICANPDTFIRFANRLSQMGLIAKSRLAFLEKNLADADRRRQVYEVWNLLSPLTPRKAVIQYHLKKYPVPLHLLMGAQDAVSPPASGQSFIRGMKNATLQVLPCGHHFNNEKIVAQVCRIIQSTTSL